MFILWKKMAYCAMMHHRSSCRPMAATLIEGPVDARFIWNDPANGYSIDNGCIFTTGIAKCRAAIVTDTVVTTSSRATEAIVSFAVQGGGLPPPSSSPTRAPVSITPTPTSESNGSASATSLAHNINGRHSSLKVIF